MLIRNKLYDIALKNAKRCMELAWRRCSLLKCIPKYSKCQAERQKILGIYLTCQQQNMQTWNVKKKSKVRYEVDHSIPLNNSLVCGLHCAENLRIIPQKANAVKGNVFTCYIEKNGVITALEGLTSGNSYVVQATGKKKRVVRAKTKQKLVKKGLKNAVKRVLASKNRPKTVKNRLKAAQNRPKLYKNVSK